MEDEISTQEAADLLDMDISSIQRLCRAEPSPFVCRYDGRGRHKTWYVSRASVEAYKQVIAQKRPGRPAGWRRGEKLQEA